MKTLRTTKITSIGAILAMLLAVAVSLLVPSGNAQASPSKAGCYAASCTGLDPSKTKCANDAYTGASKEIEGGILELRYSPSCKSNWARYTQYGHENIGTWARELIGKMARTASKAWIWIPGQAPVGSINNSVTGTFGSFGPGDTTWTAMIDGTTKVCTSVAIVFSTPSAGGSTSDRIEENYDGKCG
ncbi:hypothetical protein J2T10_004123 [Paenarthrobacter nicotinovorans]|uniref:DUF2690 domain-containing protein n=1 Tax=Paenarthrobacter nicotinovorans TaxID=29320 RepID=A0ABT9TRZ6_PAENI|nr:DUF2690 domain-containing protein [Paenarthrobacter nicotinovorans]MDQ0104448.1 hypothetical protein [Paenarthrobacter nicotinovorans]